ncbi:metal ABC transporter substrate-binding protein [Candidatus Riflebacteria bacterium]
MKKLTLLTLFIVLFQTSLFCDTIRCVSSITVIREILEDIGGDKVSVKNICPHNQDLHFVIIKPSHVAMLANAELFAHAGAWAEPWRPSLVESANNRRLFPGNTGDLDLSQGIKMLEVPTSLSREFGDLHPSGNPHYWMDPVNIIIMGRTVRDKLTELRSQSKEYFAKNFQSFADKWKRNIRQWVKRCKQLPKIKIIDYHNSWVYLYKRFKVQLIAHIEPKPGIKPSGSYLGKLIKKAHQQGANFLIYEPHHPPRDIQMLIRNVKSLSPLRIPQIPGGKYPMMAIIFETIISTFEKANEAN